VEPVVYGFAGREFDGESGLYYNRARMFSPETGRFLIRDPLGYNANDINLYRYVFNRPLIIKDPFGLFAYDPEEDPFYKIVEAIYLFHEDMNENRQRQTDAINVPEDVDFALRPYQNDGQNLNNRNKTCEW
jgi:RHS repeat-associated protein